MVVHNQSPWRIEFTRSFTGVGSLYQSIICCLIQSCILSICLFFSFTSPSVSVSSVGLNAIPLLVSSWDLKQPPNSVILCCTYFISPYTFLLQFLGFKIAAATAATSLLRRNNKSYLSSATLQAISATYLPSISKECLSLVTEPHS